MKSQLSTIIFKISVISFGVNSVNAEYLWIILFLISDILIIFVGVSISSGSVYIELYTTTYGSSVSL